VKAEVKERLAELGVTTEILQKVYSAKSQAEGDAALKAAKEICKKGFRQAALSYHPDVTGGDKEKTEHFKRLLSVYTSFMKSRFKYRPKTFRSAGLRSDLEIMEDFLRRAEGRRRAGTYGRPFRVHVDLEAERRAAAARAAAAAAGFHWGRSPWEDLFDVYTNTSTQAERDQAEKKMDEYFRQMQHEEAQERSIFLPHRRSIWLRHLSKWIKTKRRKEHGNQRA